MVLTSASGYQGEWTGGRVGGMGWGGRRSGGQKDEFSVLDASQDDVNSLQLIKFFLT